ncbi:MAG TPA: chromate transporter [Verrucomicrobia bacterium]|nr:chromate transporter [Verrucomicrobiota bacterium]
MSTHLLLFWTFFKISLFSIGGGYNMIPLMQDEVVANGWLASERFLDVLAVSEITPGPIAVNLATFAGYQVAGLTGSIAATIGVCLPGAILLLALGVIAMHLRDRPAFRAAMRGLMPALVGLLAATAIRLALALVPSGARVPPPHAIVLFAVALGLFLWKNLHPALLMLGAAFAGIAFSLF